MSTAGSHLRQYCCCSATVIYYYVRPRDVRLRFAGESVGRMRGPALLSAHSISPAQIPAMLGRALCSTDEPS